MKYLKQSIAIVILLNLCGCGQNPSKQIQQTQNISSMKQQLKPDFDLQGHRGARGLYPENSIYGFVETVKMGVKTLELDVIVSKDKQLVVSHEPYLNPEICLLTGGKELKDETEGKKYNLYQMTVAEIQAFDCGSKPHPRFPEQKKQKVYKPTFKELIKAINELDTTIRFNIEMKSSEKEDNIFQPVPQEFAKLLYNELKELDLLKRVCVQSFDVRCLQEFKKLDGQVVMALLVENTLSYEGNLKLLGFNPPIYSPYFRLLNKEIVAKLHDQNIKVIPWTVNEKTDMQLMVDAGVDGLITDYPNRFYEVFEK